MQSVAQCVLPLPMERCCMHFQAHYLKVLTMLLKPAFGRTSQLQNNSSLPHVLDMFLRHLHQRPQHILQSRNIFKVTTHFGIQTLLPAVHKVLF